MRRTGFVALAALAALALALLPIARAQETGKPDAKDGAAAEYPYDWGVAYFMSYDNNLEKCGEPIIGMIEKGVVGERTVAAVQADFSDLGGMHRITITPKGRSETRVDSDNSADEDVAIAYLEWFVKTYRCKRYVVTFLNHGGKIDDMCADDKPGTPGAKQWMSGHILGAKMRKLKEKMPGRFELLFLQQCGRGSVENLYSFRGTSDFIMSSPVPVGAPNTYYEAFHRFLSATPETTGDKLAEKIAAEDEHYTIYTCLRTEKLEELPKRIDAAIKPLVAKARLEPAGKLRAIQPVGEPIVDAKTCLERLAANNSVDAQPIAAFFEWTRKDLFTMVRFQARSERMAGQLCGLSIFAPRNADEAARYAKLDLLKETKLPALWKRTLEPAPGKAGGGGRLFDR